MTRAGRHRNERGTTLIEVMVASTIFVLFVAGMYSATGMFYSLVDIQRNRTDSLTAMNVSRSRIIADARGASSIACPGSGTVEFTTTGGGPPRIVEYTSDGDRLIRWESVDNKNYWVADGVSSLDCDLLSGNAGVEVAVMFGKADDRFALHLSFLDLLSGGGPS